MPQAPHIDAERNQEILESDAAWVAATSEQRAAAAGLDFASLARQARRRFIAVAVSLGAGAVVLYAAFAIVALESASARNGNVLWLAAGAGVVIVALVVSQVLVALVGRLRPDWGPRALSIVTAGVSDALLVLAIVLVAQASTASQLAPRPLLLGVGFVWALLPIVLAIQIPIAVLKTASPQARRSARAMLDLDPRWTGIGAGIGWVVAGHLLSGVAAAASVVVLFASPSPWTGILLAALMIATDIAIVVTAANRRMGWALAIAAAAVILVVIWAVAATGAGG
ncbi:hypothetical protein [Agromyces bauzanensis]